MALVRAKTLHRSPVRQQPATRRRPPEADLISTSEDEPLSTWDLVDVPRQLAFGDAPTWLEVEIGRALPRRKGSRSSEWNKPQEVSPQLQIRTRDGYVATTRDMGNGMFLVSAIPNGVHDLPDAQAVVGNAMVESIMKSLGPIIEAATRAAEHRRQVKAQKALEAQQAQQAQPQPQPLLVQQPPPGQVMPAVAPAMAPAPARAPRSPFLRTSHPPVGCAGGRCNCQR